MIMRSVMLAAVHYGELSESPASKVVQQLVTQELVQDVIEVVDQPPLSEVVETSELVSWRRTQRLLESRWRKYLKESSRVRDLAALINQSFYSTRLRLGRRFRASQWHTRQIERFVTAKHVDAWQKFVASPSSALVLLEADATFTPDSLRRLTQALVEVVTDVPTYINLAGGLDRSAIAIENLATDDLDGMMVFSQPVTNTSCAYVINRSLVVELLSFLDAFPEARNLGIDWLFNAFFVNETSKGESIRCFHSEPPALLHGSLIGVTRSWHPDR